MPKPILTIKRTSRIIPTEMASRLLPPSASSAGGDFTNILLSGKLRPTTLVIPRKIPSKNGAVLNLELAAEACSCTFSIGAETSSWGSVLSSPVSILGT